MNTSFQQFKKITKLIAMILSWTIFSLLLLIIGFLVYYLVCTNIYATKGEKFEPKFSLYTIVSPSMEPNIKVYDVILNTRVDDANDIKVGDVITFISTSNISNGMTVTHRVTNIVQGKDGLEFKTKGDNNLSEDTDTAKENNVLGKVLLKIPQLGRLQFFLSSNGGWLIVIVCPALFIIVNDIFKIIKLNKAKKAINNAEGNDEPYENKLELEAFRKEEIKQKLNKKDQKQARKVAKIKEEEIKQLTTKEVMLLDFKEDLKDEEEIKQLTTEETMLLDFKPDLKEEQEEVQNNITNIFGESLEKDDIFGANTKKESESLKEEKSTETPKNNFELPKLKDKE